MYYYYFRQHVFKVTVLFEDCHAKSVDEMTVYCWMFNEFIMKIKLFNYDEAYLKIVITVSLFISLFFFQIMINCC